MRRHSHNLKLHSSISPTAGGGSAGNTGAGSSGGGGGTTTTTATMSSSNRERLERMRNRSDSETLSDEPIQESNDEGIGTDHIDEKIEDGEIRSAKELELYMGGSELIETGKNILAAEPVADSLMGTDPAVNPASTSVAAAAAGPSQPTPSPPPPAPSVAETTTTTVTMAQLQLPSIVIQSENGDRALSPVSSRSESPIRCGRLRSLLID